MYVATLLTAPSEPVLTASNVLEYHKALNGGEFRWLAQGSACEFHIPECPHDIDRIWQRLQDRGVDLVVQLAANRRKKMLLADMDSTMIEQECLDELSDEAGFGAEVAAITDLAMNGHMDFKEALDARVALLKGLSEHVIDKVLETRITPRPGGAQLLATMKENGAHTVLVSGGFTDFAEGIAHGLGFDECRANRFEIIDGHLSGKVIPPLLGRDAKVQALDDITARLGISASDVMAVGDGANDLGMLEIAGSGVALYAKPSVAAASDIRINFGDLTALLYLQGYAQDAFVTPSALM